MFLRWMLAAGLLMGWSEVMYGRAPGCSVVRFSDVGWTDITASTAVASTITEALGVKAEVMNVSVPVTYASLKNKDIDVFLGNWMPTMAADIKPYLENHSVQSLQPVLTGARYTLAVPSYVAAAGVKSFADLDKFHDKFAGKIYGIEPGNDGNRLIQKMISGNAFGLKDWKLVESSEQAMLMQVLRAAKSQQWVVFLGWEPHPMNTKLDLVYLTGGDEYFGPDQGRSTVYINTRAGYVDECPMVGAFLKNFSLTLAEMNTLMGFILDGKMPPQDAARKWLQANPDRISAWLKGVKTLKGEDGATTVRAAVSAGREQSIVL